KNKINRPNPNRHPKPTQIPQSIPKSLNSSYEDDRGGAQRQAGEEGAGEVQRRRHDRRPEEACGRADGDETRQDSDPEVVYCKLVVKKEAIAGDGKYHPSSFEHNGSLELIASIYIDDDEMIERLTMESIGEERDMISHGINCLAHQTKHIDLCKYTRLMRQVHSDSRMGFERATL
ncbi:hypothetical protein AKJ16_DCAP09987, partial [Drosera capensis]